jgi:phage gp36-like protein
MGNIKFLRQKDYEQQITDEDLITLAGLEESIRLGAEDAAQAEMESYLLQRFDVATMFRSVTDYDNALTYVENSRIQWIEADYDDAASYLVNDLVNYLGNIFINIQASQGTDPSNTLFWTNIGVYEGIYIRQGTTITAGNLPNNTTFWTYGDDRDAQLRTFMIDIVLFRLHPRLSPRVIPDLRVDLYKQAVTWLKDAAKGLVSTTFPLDLDADGNDQGGNITYNSNDKLKHSY